MYGSESFNTYMTKMRLDWPLIIYTMEFHLEVDGNFTSCPDFYGKMLNMTDYSK